MVVGLPSRNRISYETELSPSTKLGAYQNWIILGTDESAKDSGVSSCLGFGNFMWSEIEESFKGGVCRDKGREIFRN
ncbi:uncharacterized protein A4U43_C08F4500 [Asparagus officinalis]|nr:uncharacterized protein A4U43_C08F4500 [Asparagus officinalis]